MRTHLLSITLAAVLAGALAPAAIAESVPPALQAKIDEQVKVIQTWANAPVVVAAVKAQNAAMPADLAAMTQDKWTMLNVLDPTVRALTKNEAATFLKGNKNELVTEAFVSSANGAKVAFLSKPTNWIHKGKPKHDVPMTGKVWYGPIEVDASSGAQQVQVGVPVLDGGKPIGSLVVGLGVSALGK